MKFHYQFEPFYEFEAKSSDLILSSFEVGSCETCDRDA